MEKEIKNPKPKGFIGKTINVPKPIHKLKAPDVSMPMSKGQQMLTELFSGRQEPLWGTGNNLPILHRTLTSGGGLIKNGDKRRETGGMFGLR